MQVLIEVRGHVSACERHKLHAHPSWGSQIAKTEVRGCSVLSKKTGMKKLKSNEHVHTLKFAVDNAMLMLVSAVPDDCDCRQRSDQLAKASE